MVDPDSVGCRSIGVGVPTVVTLQSQDSLAKMTLFDLLLASTPGRFPATALAAGSVIKIG